MKMIPRVALYGMSFAIMVLPACRSSSSKYKYLQQGQTQIRIEEKSGRTDRLMNNGWIPISFDSPSVEVPKDQLRRVSATIVAGDVFDRIAGPLCYTVDNDSDFVLKEIWVELSVVKSSTSEPKRSEDKVPLLLPLSSQIGGFAPVGNKFVMCYDRKDDFSKWDPLSAVVNSAQGWKQ
jgi:hypothetical protein